MARSICTSPASEDGTGCHDVRSDSRKGNDGFQGRASKPFSLSAVANHEVKEAFDFDGYLIDVWLQARQETSRDQAGGRNEKAFQQGGPRLDVKVEEGVAILCHTSQTVHRETGRPLGPAIMRHRHLRRRREYCGLTAGVSTIGRASPFSFFSLAEQGRPRLIFLMVAQGNSMLTFSVPLGIVGYV